MSKKINLALQGGGSHGAFTWGVLDALLEDGRLEIEAITGASAGAMNAVVLADGMIDNPNDPRSGARQALHDFWHDVSVKPGFSTARGSFLMMFDLMSRIVSPYQTNPLNINPLRDVLKKRVDFDRLRKKCPVKLFVCATNVRTGRSRIFSEKELVPNMLMASTCLPFFWQAIEIDGQAYWDGGYTGNPPLFPLHQCTQSKDLVLVQINPLIRDDVPTTAAEIIDRVNEISFNTALMLEMRSIEFVQRLLHGEKIDPKKYKEVYFHMVHAEEKLRSLGANSKFNTSWSFLTELRDIGREAARSWLSENFHLVGQKNSVDIAKTFL